MSELINQVIDLAVQIQQIAAPTFDEMKRAEFARNLFVEEGFSDVSMDELGNVYGRLSVENGKQKDAKPLIVSAHLDTVFPLETDLRATREAGLIRGPGLGDNSLGVAALFGLRR